MADYRISIKDYNESEVKSAQVTARNRKEALRNFIDSYGSYIDARTERLEIKKVS
jgi:hypothetical protein